MRLFRYTGAKDRRAKLLKVLDDIEADQTYMISILNQSGKGGTK